MSARFSFTGALFMKAPAIPFFFFPACFSDHRERESTRAADASDTDKAFVAKAQGERRAKPACCRR
jgi:hypothetical protein